MRALSADRNRLAMENVVLRHQLNVLKRGAKQARRLGHRATPSAEEGLAREQQVVEQYSNQHDRKN